MFDLEILKSPLTSSSIRTPHSSPSPSSTLSESSSSPITISTRKPRTPRKRPNQTYNEAAALLSTACPNVFSPKNLTRAGKFTKPHDNPFFFDDDKSSELLLPFRVIEDQGCLLNRPILEQSPSFRIQPRVFEKMCRQSPVQSECQEKLSMHCDEYQKEEDFDADSILDEEIGDGIDSIMGDLSADKPAIGEIEYNTECYNGGINGWNVGGRFEYGFGFGMNRGMRALRNVDRGGDLWIFPTVDIQQISPKLNKVASAEKRKKKKKVEKPVESRLELPEEDSILKPKTPESSDEIPLPRPNSHPSLILKLNYEEVLSAWSDRSPFAGEFSGSESHGIDASVRS